MLFYCHQNQETLHGVPAENNSAQITQTLITIRIHHKTQLNVFAIKVSTSVDSFV